MRIAWTLILVGAALLALAAGQLFAHADLPAVLLAAFAARPAWILAVAAAVSAGLLLLAARRGRALRHLRLAAGAIALAALAFATAIAGAWQGRAPYRRAVVYFSADDGTRLAATLYQPDGGGPHPGIVLAPGSAAAPRRIYGYVADRLCRAGFTVLVADKRGIGDSAGGYDRDNNSSRETLELLGNDLGASWDWLVKQPGVDPRHTGFWGVSQAGWTVPVALVRAPRAAFAVLMSGPVSTTSEEGAWSDLAGENADPMGKHEPPLPFAEIEHRLDALPIRGFDPQPYLERVNVPMLYVYGAWDNSEPAARSAARIEALARRGKPFSAVVIPEANHLLLIARGPHHRMIPAFAPEAWPTMLDWLRLQSGRP